MTAAIQLIYFLHMFAVGVVSPVLALALMAHGADIHTVSLLIGVYSLTVIAAEFPSGVLADLIGQKRVYLLSSLFALLCYGLVLFSQSLLLLMPAMIASGLSRAFASGTLDALAVNQTPDRDEGTLLRLTSRFAVLESAGLGLGALSGGLLAGIGSGYTGNIATLILLYALLLLLTAFTIRDAGRPAAEGKPSVRSLFQGQVKRSVSCALQSGVMRAVLVLTAITGFALIAIETYWQPAYTAFQPAPWTLGLVSFLGFFGVMIGSQLLSFLLKKHGGRVPLFYLLSKGMLGLMLAGLFLAAHAAPFVGIYVISYLFLGSSTVAENTLVHRRVADSQRSSVLSLFSLIMQLGCIAASITGYGISAQADYRLMWPIAGALLMFSAAVLLLYLRSRSRREPV